MKKFGKLVILLMMVALLSTACQSAAPTAAPVATSAPVETVVPFKVALIIPSAKNDLAFGQSMYQTLVKIQGDMGEANFQFVVSDNMFVVDDAATAIRDYASQGYDLVIAHGSQYGSALKEIAPDFPKTSFAWGTAGDTFDIPNIFAYEAFSQEGGYVNGVLAAALDKSGVIGVVGPVEVGDAKLYVDGFVAGVKATKPDVTVNINYTGSFSDVALASEAAQTHIGAGADVLTGSAQMVVGAIGVAKEKGVLWFGTQADQASLAPSIVVACQVYDWSAIVEDIISLVKKGTLGAKTYALTLENNGLVMTYNPGYDLAADVRAQGDAAVKGIIDGTITIGVGGK
ncbi:MAG: BMP family ABC transporter substrate-binding protein [Chloroflexi bacterium 44-23]|nr:MAG: BMP family ABC transporter substrate-binding protein [Chloroflexi bacterium 44-23]